MTSKPTHPLKIAHLSDLHFRNRIPGPANIPTRHGRTLYKKFPQILAKLEEEGIDILVLTGDILDAPRWMTRDGFYYDVDISYWEQMVYLDYLSVAAMLKSVSFKTIILPGNHDHPKMFRKVFGRQLEPVEVKGYTFYAFADWPHRASHGRRFDKERKFFDEALLNGPENQIHCQHYVIAPEVTENYPYNYAEYKELWQRIETSGKVRLSLNGHYHQGAMYVNPDKKERGTHFITVKALSELPFYYNIYELNGESISISEKNLGGLAEQRKAIFLDRDGCLTQAARFYGGPEDIQLMEGVGEALKKLREKGYVLILVTDQACVGMGYSNRDFVHWTHDELCKQLTEAGVELEGIYFSIGAGKEGVLEEFKHTRFKKPSPDFILKAEKDLHIDLSRSYMVGDRWTDCLCGIKAGVKSVLVRTGLGTEQETLIPENQDVLVVDDMASFAKVCD